MNRLKKHIPMGLSFKRGRMYLVTVLNAKGFDLSFKTKISAMNYRRAIAKSNALLSSKITRIESFDGYVVEQEVK